jgi:Ca-activated chloride channel family protein
VLAAGYLALLRQRRRVAARLPGFAGSAGGKPPRSWKGHVAPALLLLALGTLIVAAARPVTLMTMITDQKTIMLAMDVSASMRAEDVAPSRLSAAQMAAKAFVQGLPRDIRVGVVAYGGAANLVQSPTRRRADIVAAIDGFEAQPGTAVGNGLVLALCTLFPRAGIHLDQLSDFRRARDLALSDLVDEEGLRDGVKPGSYASAVVVLLSDGQNTMGVDPIEAANLAARLGVKVFTVGFGTDKGEVIHFGGRSLRVRLDEETLKRIASISRGLYFNARTAAQLERAYESMTTRLGLERVETEISALFAAAGAVLLCIALGVSAWWYGRLV